MTKLTAAAIRDAMASNDRLKVQETITAAEVQAPQMRAIAEAGRAEAIDPTLSDTEARAARKEADDAAFSADRMDAALQALRNRLQSLAAQEAEEARAAVIKLRKPLHQRPLRVWRKIGMQQR